MSEPNSGSDLASVRTRAREGDGGWYVNGQKIWTSGAHHADYMIALVRTSEGETRHTGLTQMVNGKKSSDFGVLDGGGVTNGAEASSQYSRPNE